MIIRKAEQVENLATDLCDWLSEYNPARRRTELLPINESDEFEVLQLRRLAGSLYTSSKVPVAAAAYGASQVGKSLFMGQVLRPVSENYCPIGGDETLGEPAYYKNLSFDNDLNPQCGSQEATALVTRFTTKDRIGAGVSPQFPVMVRALTRAEWLRVLARGFHAECKTPATTWQQTELETLFEDLAAQISRPAGRSQVADGHPRRLFLHAGGRSPRFPGHRGRDQRTVEPLPADGRGLRRGGRLALLGQVAHLDGALREDRQFPQANHAGQPRPGHLLPLGGRPLPAGQPALEGLRAAQLEDLEPRGLDRHLSHAQGEVLRPRVPPRHGHGHRGAGNDPGRHPRVGHARAAAPPERRMAEGDRADGLPRRAGHAGRAHGHRARQAHERRHAGGTDGDREARQGLVPFRALCRTSCRSRRCSSSCGAATWRSRPR